MGLSLVIKKKLIKLLRKSKRPERSESARTEACSLLWSELPYDILCCIMERLRLVDLIHFRAVCKKWRAVAGIKPKDDKLPWIVTLKFDSNNRMYPCSLYDISTHKSYMLDHRIRRPYGHLVRKQQVCAARNGWLLLVCEFPPVTNSMANKKTCFYLFNPFSDELVDLPSLQSSNNVKATFTSTHPSQNCSLIAIHNVVDYYRRRVMCISSYCHGDQRWTRRFTGDFGIHLQLVIGVVYIRGMLYCIFRSGEVGCFNPVTNTYDKNLMTNSGFVGRYVSFEARAFESSDGSGEVFLVLYKIPHQPINSLGQTRRVQWHYDQLNYRHIFRLDWVKRAWVKVPRWPEFNRVLFLGDTISYCFRPGAVGGEDRSLAGGRIYCPGFFNRDYYQEISSPPDPLNSLPIYRWCKRCDESRKIDQSLRIWIQPPTLLS